jgi:methionyl-tRNA formyltransferase
VLLAAGGRGLPFLRHLRTLVPGAQLTVCSFREDPWEEPFLDAIAEEAARTRCAFLEVRTLDEARWERVSGGEPVDLLFSVGWRYLVPPAVYEQVRTAAVVLHDSLLPAYRGFAPTNWAIINGERETGATLFLMAEAVDAGPIIGQRAVPIGPDETIAQVAEQVTGAYLALLDAHLPALLDGRVDATPQDESRASYTVKRTPADGLIDWTQPARRIHDLVRALTHPWPGAHTTFNGKRMHVWSARPLKGMRLAGAVSGRVASLAHRPLVGIATGDGVLLLDQVQMEGEPARPAAEVLRSPTDTLGGPLG